MAFSTLRRMTGFVEVTETHKRITISGVATRALSDMIKQYWTTTKIAANMFIVATGSRIVIPSFFAIEFLYILKVIRDNTRRLDWKRTINNIASAMLEDTWLKSLDKPVTPWFDWDATKIINYTLLPHQVNFLKKYEEVKVRYNLRGMLLFAPPGSGKSLTDVAVALGTNSTKCIIVCPKNANYNVWEKTLTKDMVPQDIFIADRDAELAPEKRWHVFHYETLERAIELVSKWNLNKEKVCIILDESHNFNDIKSLRTARFVYLCQVSQSQDIIWASGTPVKALGTETIPFLKTIDPLFDKRAEEAFRKMYGRDATRTLDILNHRLGIVSFTVPKSTVMTDAPIVEAVKIQMPNSDKYTLEFLSGVMSAFIEERMKHYTAIRPEVIKWYREVMEKFEKTLKTPQEFEDYKRYQLAVRTLMAVKFDAAQHADFAMYTNKYEKEVIIPRIPKEDKAQFIDYKSIVKYPLLKVRGECLGRILTKERVQCHVDMLEHINFPEIIGSIEKKTLIFTSYVKVVDACYDQLARLKYTPLRVYGETNHELPAIVGKFAKDPNANPLVATFQSLSTAVPLTMANGIIFLNSPWRSFERDQAIARAHRIGQDKPVYVFDIILDTGEKVNISSRSVDIMQWSRDQVDAITGVKGEIEVSTESNDLPIAVKGDISDLIEDVRVAEDETDTAVLPTFADMCDGERIKVAAFQTPETEQPDLPIDFSKMSVTEMFGKTAGNYIEHGGVTISQEFLGGPEGFDRLFRQEMPEREVPPTNLHELESLVDNNLIIVDHASRVDEIELKNEIGEDIHPVFLDFIQHFNNLKFNNVDIYTMHWNGLIAKIREMKANPNFPTDKVYLPFVDEHGVWGLFDNTNGWVVEWDGKSLSEPKEFELYLTHIFYTN